MKKDSLIKIHPKLRQLQTEIGGDLKNDGELYHGVRGKEIYISTKDGVNFALWSRCPLCVIKDGRPHLAHALTAGENKGYYRVVVPFAGVKQVTDWADAKGDASFAYEGFIHDYCRGHLERIEKGLRLYRTRKSAGVEVGLDGKSIDILAINPAAELVVVELKCTTAKAVVLAQLLGYMTRVRKSIAKPNQPVRGIIVAKHIHQDLRLAAEGQKDINLQEYTVKIEFKTI